MARASTNKIYRTFVRGLITEANELTYPENATIDEDNCVLYRKGNRSRRLGLNLEQDGTVSGFSSDPNVVYQEYVWKAVANDAKLNFLVCQIGAILHIWDLSVKPLSAGYKNCQVLLNDRLMANAVNPELSEVQMASGKGVLFIVGEKLEPFQLQYDPVEDKFTIKPIFIQIRDFQGLQDNLANDEEPATLSIQHHYNLRNQGWVNGTNTGGGASVQYFDSFGNAAYYNAPNSTPITQYHAKIGRYPANNKQWWTARDATTNDFDPELLAKFYTGNNRAPRGHFVVNAFYIDRSAVSGVQGIAPEVKNERPVSVSFFSGRVWYLSGSTLYFSQLLDNVNKSGFCYQEGDPTAEDFSDLLPTDGGVVPIPEMARGVRLIPLGSELVVFGTNGIWAVSGGTSGFTASDFSVSKVNPIGTEFPGSVVEAENQIYWWSQVGIMAMSPKMGQFGPVEGTFDRTNISEQTIQTFYNNKIPSDKKRFVKGQYDPTTNCIQWLYSDKPTLANYSYNRILNLDLTLQAFYPWSVNSDFGPVITGLFAAPEITDVDHPQIRDSTFKFTFRCADNCFGFATFSDTSFADWKYQDGVGVGFKSFADTGYEILEDAMRKKMTPWVFTYFRRTEETFVPDGDDYKIDKPSSCYFQTRWDWSNSQMSNKWSTKYQAYRHTRLPSFTDDDLRFDTGYPIVVSRHKVRGVGKAIQFRFECDEIGKDFDLLGWATNVTGTTNV